MAGLGRRAGAAGADVVGGGRRRQPRRRSCRFRRGGASGRGEGGKERTSPRRTGGGGRDVGPVLPRGWPLTSRSPRWASRRRTDWRSDPVGPEPQRRKRAPSAGRGFYRAHRGNSDPFRVAAEQPRGAPGAWLGAPQGASCWLRAARRGTAAVLRVCS